MLASVSDNIVPLITSTRSAIEAWIHLERTYASKSHTRVMGLREILANTTTKDMSIANYMQTVKSISKTLALSGSPMSDAELIHAALRGLGSKFRSLDTAIRARDSLISFEELHDKLANYELTLKCNEAKNEKTIVTAQFNQRSNYNTEFEKSVEFDTTQPIRNRLGHYRTNTDTKYDIID